MGNLDDGQRHRAGEGQMKPILPSMTFFTTFNSNAGARSAGNPKSAFTFTRAI
jgi:hypothetical protein